MIETDRTARIRCAAEIVNSHNDSQLRQILDWADPDMRELILARLQRIGRELASGEACAPPTKATATPCRSMTTCATHPGLSIATN